MSAVTQRQDVHEPVAPPETTFPYGWRDVFTQRPDGTTEHRQIPLTLEEALHPELDYVMPEGSPHLDARTYLYEVLRVRMRTDPHALVTSDLLVYWDIPELDQHSPDIGVIFGVRDRDAPRSSFHVAAEGTRPRLIIELVSPNTRKNDVLTKVEHYHQARVQCYVVADRTKDTDPWVLRGYEYAPAGYVEMPKDARGRLWLKDLGVWLGVDGQNLVCYDGVTDAPIGDYLHMVSKAEHAQARADALEVRVRELEAELAGSRGAPPAPDAGTLGGD